MQYASKYYTCLIALIARVIICDPNFLYHGFLQNINVHPTNFLNGWIHKMDFMTSHYGRKMNSLAILSLLPCLAGDIVQTYFVKLMSYAVPLIENFIYMKSSAPQKSTNLLPFAHNKSKQNKDKSQSDRKDEIKSEDAISKIVLDVFFCQKCQEMCQSLNINYEQIRKLIESDARTLNLFDVILFHQK